MRLALPSVLFFAGCVSARASVPDDFVAGTNGQSLVIGRLDGGGEWVIPVAKIGFFDRLSSITLAVENDATGEKSEIVCDQKGGSDAWFFVAMPPGSYSVLAVKKGEAHAANGQRVDAPFERRFRGVERGRTSADDPEGREPKLVVGHEPIVYVGTLVITLERQHRDAGWYFAGLHVAEGQGTWFPEFPYARGWSIKDEHDEMLKVFRARYPNITQEPVTSLMAESRGPP